MHISLSKMRHRSKRRRGSNAFVTKPSSKSNVKPQRIYLAEPHDYFGIRYILRMQERQRQLASEGNAASTHLQGADSKTLKSENGIGLTSTRRLYDLHLKPSEMNSEKEKRGVFGPERYHCSRATIAYSVPMKQVLARKFKSYWSKLAGSKITSLEKQKSETSGSVLPADMNADFDDHIEAVGQPETVVTEVEALTGRHVRFSPDTKFVERNEKSPFWVNLLEKQRERSSRKVEEEEAQRPRPFLPFLEAGLSYRNEEEFYQLKNTYRSASVSQPTDLTGNKTKSNSCWKLLARLFSSPGTLSSLKLGVPLTVTQKKES